MDGITFAQWLAWWSGNNNSGNGAGPGNGSGLPEPTHN